MHCIDRNLQIMQIDLFAVDHRIVLGIVGCSLLMILVIFLIIYLGKRQKLAKELSRMLWKVSYHDIVPVKEYVRNMHPMSCLCITVLSLIALQHERSQGSTSTVSTAMSDEMIEIVQKGLEQVASYKGTLVWMRIHNGNFVVTSQEHLVELKLVAQYRFSNHTRPIKYIFEIQMRDLSHENLNPFISLCIDAMKPISLWTYCPKSNLEDVMQISCPNAN